MRSRYRSQPKLQRTGPPPGLVPVTLGLSAAAVFAWVLVFQQRQAAAPAQPQLAGVEAPKVEVQPQAANPAPAPGPAPAPAPAEAVPAAPFLPTEPPSVALAQAPSSISQAAAPNPAAPRIEPKPDAAPRARPRDGEGLSPALRAWRQERERYAEALDDYNARERAEGYRWAKRYDVASIRYCRAAADRTRAFMQGCLAYARGD